MENIVQISDLEFSYATSKQPAIHEINLNIKKGDYVDEEL